MSDFTPSQQPSPAEPPSSGAMPPAPPAAPAPSSAPPYASAPQQAYQPGAYPPSAYGGYGYAAPQKSNVLSIISMISSIAGFIWILPFLGSVAGVIMGHISLGQIKRTGEKGRGMALAGIIVGYVGLAFLLVIAAVIVFAIWASEQSSRSGFSSY